MKEKIFLFLIGIIGGILIGGMGYHLFFKEKASFSGSSGLSPILSSKKAGEKVIKFIKENLPAGIKASLVSIGEESGLYKVKLKVQDQEYISYVTKDGRLFFPQEPVNLEALNKKHVENQLPKREKPDVKLFVMSYCPFGLQTQKMFLEVYKLLGDKADMGVYFVDYTMHGEKELEENLRQYCIEKEEKEKYPDYLGCFLKEGKSEECLSEAKIDEEKLKDCISQTKKEYEIKENSRSFNVHKELNEKYEVRGSPTIVINDMVLAADKRYCPTEAKCFVFPEFNRSPEKFKEAICQAFLSSPKECETKLSLEAFSPGFGFKKGTSDSGSCN